jgi:integrase
MLSPAIEDRSSVKRAARVRNQSEATGLTVDRVDFLRRTVTVDRQLVTPKAGPCTFGPPKTARSMRKIPLADHVVEALAAHIEHHGVGEHDLLLHIDGAPIRRPRFGGIWRDIRADAGLTDVRYHDTRHTFASTLLSGGVSVAATAEYLGHTPVVLLSTYAHLVPADHERARSVVEAAFARDAACHAGVTAANASMRPGL